jgi:hypothetical protein
MVFESNGYGAIKITIMVLGRNSHNNLLVDEVVHHVQQVQPEVSGVEGTQHSTCVTVMC